MLKKLFFLFLSRPVTTGMFLLCVVVLGTASLMNIPVELSPQMEYPKLTVSAYWSNAAPETVEAFLTSPLESALSTTKGLKKISSRSSEGNCTIDLEFHPAINMEFARLEINEKIGATKDELPFGITPPKLSPYIPSELRELQGFLTYTISANVPADEIRKYAIDNIQNKILAINGISNVEVNGGSEKLLSIRIDYNRAKALGIDNEEINKAIENIEKLESAGNIKRGTIQLAVKIVNDISDIKVIENQPVKILPDNVIRIKDIGQVINGFEEHKNIFRINGKETVTIEINKEPGANTISTANEVFEAMKEMQAILPPGYVISKAIDKSQALRQELNELYSDAAYSLLIIIAALFIIFRKAKYAFIIIIAIMFSLLFSMLLFYSSGISINIMTLSSITLGFGLIVDNSIVVLDYMDKNYKGGSLKKLTVIIKEIFFPVFTSTLATIGIFSPLVFMSGEMRVYFIQFALAVVFTLSSSLIAAFTIVPLCFVKYAYNTEGRKAAENQKKTERFYGWLLTFLSRKKKLGVILLVLTIGLPVWMIPRRISTPVISSVYNAIFDSELYGNAKKYIDYALGGSLNLYFNHINKGRLWNYGDEAYLLVRMQLPNGNDIGRINKLTADFESEILSYEKNIKTVSARILNEQSAYIKIDFPKEVSASSFPYMLQNYLSSYAAQLGGLRISVLGFGNVFQSGGETLSKYQVKALGFNFSKLKSIAEAFKEEIAKNPRIDNIDIDGSEAFRFTSDSYEIVAAIKRDKLAGSNIKADNLIQTIAKNTNGSLGWNKFRIENEEIKYEVKYLRFMDLRLDELENLIVSNNDGGFARVGDLVDFQVRRTMNTISREDRQYVRYISFDYKGPAKHGDAFIDGVIKKIKLQEGYKLENENVKYSMNENEEQELWKTLLISALLIFIITAGLFESLKKPFLVVFAIPFAFIGTILLFYLGEYSLDRGAYAGMLILMGLSVNNSIILVDYISKNVKKTSKWDDVIKISYNRLRPVFATTVTTICALFPLLLSSENNFWKSLSVSVTGGIVISALIVVVYVPLIFIHFVSGNDK
ncbi:MAG TPA: efflux RND transporter permease subunit [Ignavibacteriales bacterium]|nr:efflux RND transporter permease subunit [Ignavibacteriales bacterium]